MVSSISSNDSDSLKEMMALMYQKMGAADTDGISGLSKDELTSIKTGDDVDGASFLNSLLDQFDQLDSDKNGQLTNSEIATASPSEPLGPPPGLNIESTDNNSADSSISANAEKLKEDLGNLAGDFGKLSTSVLDKILSSYKNGDLSNMVSSLNLAI